MTEENQTLTVRISAKEPVAEDICLFELRAPDGGPLPAFTPGAHLSVRVPTGEIRKYSLCNDPDETDRYMIAVKKDRGGRGGSVSLIDQTKEGDELAVTPPRNDFELKSGPSSYIFIAGGIGITPIRAMIKHLIATKGKPFKLYYFTRTPAMMAFREEFSDPAFRGKVVIHHDCGDPEKAYDLWPVLEEPKGAHLYCCGPRGLMEAVRDMTGHWSSAAVHFEDFGAAKARPEDNTPFVVRLAKSGESYEVPVDKSILEVLREAGKTLPSSCESGTCGTCRTRLVEGEADHRDLALSDHERARNIMICVSRAKSAELVLDL
ncbi:PDR/VanB family oxidoreductase [Ancylobacter polymorphus]|uniref:Phthalate 4,5-dioxygenase reductase subunit n=1 Tax=Ancylobacter polymorphus TaxID=223390 RepID=A0ABU0BG82_9HYPH|nr:PDR/VanB family oxidoreductase [Ancylobacter polymorphus]MDQ0304848.1 phthalate 4,5-dioxygenase reductase subunit [Ancylobacter polymorphus]